MEGHLYSFKNHHLDKPHSFTMKVQVKRKIPKNVFTEKIIS